MLAGARRRLRAALLVAGLLATLPVQVADASAHAGGPTLRQLVGQRVIARMEGSAPSASFLSRIRRGEIGGVFVFQNNVPAGGLRALVQALQSAAREGHQLPLLIATDQEGGGVRRLPGPPFLAPAAMTSGAIAQAEGRLTGTYLRSFGINTDLAPVLDVPEAPAAFIAPRSFGASAAVVSELGVAFAEGLAAAGVLATAKHFPGLGGALTNTDSSRSVITTPKAKLLTELAPFAAALSAGVPLVMISTAVYPALGSRFPAVCSRPIVTGLLRTRLGFRGTIISDDLATRAVTSVLPLSEAAAAAASAGVDLLYAAGPTGQHSERASEAVFASLLHQAERGRLSREQLLASYRRIYELKSGFHH